MTWHAWLSLLAVGFAVLAVGLAVQNRQRIGRHHETTDPTTTLPIETTQPQVAFVANPTKPGAAALHDAALAACSARNMPEPFWYETTPEDPGLAQTRQAVADGADVVVAVGGDGTVREVAAGLVGTEVAMALVPLGTGNLLARNLDLPLGDTVALLNIALTGLDRRIDVGWLTIVAEDTRDDPHTTPTVVESQRHLFLVISGLGFDAAMVANTTEDLKAKVGWMAYFLAGARHMHAHRMRVEVRLDDGPWLTLRLRSLLVGNCGRLPGGITLLPDAKLDDGWLDVGAIDTRVGMLGWTQLFGTVVAQRFGVRAELPGSIGHIEHARARKVRIRTREAQQIQVDGDVVGHARELIATVDYRALVVRVT